MFYDGQHRELMARTKVLAVVRITAAALEDGVVVVDAILLPQEHEIVLEWAPHVRGVYRLPRAGEYGLAAFADGDHAEGLLLACVSVPEADGEAGLLPELVEGTLYVHAPEGEHVRIVATGGGRVTVQADQVVVESSDVRLGGEGVSDQVVTQQRLEGALAAIRNTLSTHQHSYVAPAIPLGPAITTPGTPAQTAPPLGNASTPNVKA